jgi:hypothetical protein
MTEPLEEGFRMIAFTGWTLWVQQESNNRKALYSAAVAIQGYLMADSRPSEAASFVLHQILPKRLVRCYPTGHNAFSNRGQKRVASR